MYENWAASYDQCVREIANVFWQRGILSELEPLTNPSVKLLDLGAGTGIGASLLKPFGYKVYSLDQSLEMLRHAEKHSEQIIHLDISAIEQLKDSFDSVVAGFNTMNYLNFELLSVLFNWLANHLNAKGQMIFDYSSPYLIRWDHQVFYDFTTYQLRNEDGVILDDFSEKYAQNEINPHVHKQLIWNHQFEAEKERCSTRIQYATCEGDVLWEEVHHQYAFNCYEMEHLIHQAGLKIRKIRDLHGQFFTPSTYTHVYVVEHR